MRLYRVRAFGSIDGLVELEEPDPKNPAGRQALVRIRASSLNYRDLMGLRGQLVSFGGMPLNHIPLCDGAGEVVAIGPDVSSVVVGDRVALTFHPSWIGGEMPHALNVLGRSSGLNDGVLAEFTTVDETELVRIPRHLSYEEASTLPCAGVTAWFALYGDGALAPGNTVLTQGTGGVSLFALQLAKAGGARVIATTTSRRKMSRLRELGADIVIDASQGKDWTTEVLRATDGIGADLTVEVGGARTFDCSAAVTKCGGRISLVGALTGPPSSTAATYFLRGLRVRPTRVGSREHFEQLNRAVSVLKLRPVIDKAFGFAEARSAFASLEAAEHVGKLVITHL